MRLRATTGWLSRPPAIAVAPKASTAVAVDCHIQSTVAWSVHTASGAVMATAIPALAGRRTRRIAVTPAPAAVAITLLTAAKINYHPTFIVSNVGGDPSTLGQLLQSYSKGLANISLANGVISDSYIPGPADANSNPWVRLFKAVHDKYEPGTPFDFYTISGMTYAYGTYQALHAAGPNLTRQGFLNALETQGSTFSGPNLAPYRYSATDHDGFAGAQMDVIAGGVTRLSGPVYVSDNQDAPVTTYTQPHPLPPTSF